MSQIIHKTQIVGVDVQAYNANTTILGNTVTGSGDIVLASSPTIVTPTIASFTNAQHSHTNAAGGGALSASAITSGVFNIARLATGTPDGTKFVRDDGTLATPAGAGTVTSITAGSGLSGGAITTSGTIALDINSLTTDTSPDPDADFLATYDVSATANKKVSVGKLMFPQIIAAPVTDNGDRTTTATTDGTATAITNLSITATFISGATYMIEVVSNIYNTGVNTNYLQLWRGTVGSGAKLYEQPIVSAVANGRLPGVARYIGAITAGSQTINVGMKVSSGTMHTDGAASLSTMIITRIS